MSARRKYVVVYRYSTGDEYERTELEAEDIRDAAKRALRGAGCYGAFGRFTVEGPDGKASGLKAKGFEGIAYERISETEVAA